jgi:putative ABC transport system permease protein
MMSSFLQDLRFALRVLSKNLGFTVVTLLTLSIGIGATAAVFNLIQGVLLTPPPYPKPEQIVLLSPVRIDHQPYVRGCYTGQWLDWKKEAKSFDGIAAYFWNFNFLIRQDGSESIEGMHVTKGYFRVLGIKPVLGREFLPSEYPAPGATTFDAQRETAIILGYELWQRRFDGAPNILGKTVNLSRHQAPLTVVGVMPPGMLFLPTPSAVQEPNYDVNARVDYWAPASPDETKPKEDFWTVVGRLRDVVMLTQAQVELTGIAARQSEGDPDFEGITLKAQPLMAELNREGRRLLLPLFGAVTLVFFIACANATGLLLARGLRRQQEYAVRCALGAGRVQLFRLVAASARTSRRWDDRQYRSRRPSSSSWSSGASDRSNSGFAGRSWPADSHGKQLGQGPARLRHGKHINDERHGRASLEVLRFPRPGTGTHLCASRRETRCLCLGPALDRQQMVHHG